MSAAARELESASMEVLSGLGKWFGVVSSR